MTEIVHEWIAKAEEDFASAKLVIDPSHGKPNYDLVCFLTQQCVEKYLKGYLQHRGVAFAKTHDLEFLLDLALPFQPLWESWRSAFARLTEYAVEFRYPGDWANPSKAERALKIASSFRSDARRAFELSSDK